MNVTSFASVLFVLALTVGATAGGCSSYALSSGMGPDDGGGGSSGGRGDASTLADVTLADASSSCVPADVSGFSPTWHRPASKAGPCNAADLREFATCWLGATDGGADGSATGGRLACQGKLSAACAQCLVTPDTAERYGPIIAHRGWEELNTPGCLAYAMNDPTGVRCAASVQAVRECELQACGANCPVTATTPSGLALYSTCAAQADNGQCSGFASDAECISSVMDASAEVATCLATSSEMDLATWLGWFCATELDAGPPYDAGAPIKDAAAEAD